MSKRKSGNNTEMEIDNIVNNLFDAIKSHSLDAVKSTLENLGRNDLQSILNYVNETTGLSAIQYAVLNDDNNEIVKYLLGLYDGSIIPEIQIRYPEFENYPKKNLSGGSLLHGAVLYGCPKNVKVLLPNSNILAVDERRLNVLHIAVNSAAKVKLGTTISLNIFTIFLYSDNLLFS
jgi:ankyrin repeat protein